MMRRLLLLCLLLSCSTVAARARQTTAAGPSASPPASSAADAPPDVEVIKHSWAKERYNWEGNPFGGTVESFEELNRRLADQRRIERARATGNAAEAKKLETEARAEQVIKSRPPASPKYGFRYTATFRNTGAKTVRQIDWDYLFYDAATKQLVGRIELGSDDKIEPGKKREVSFFIATPPTRTISLQALNTKERAGLTEQIVLVRVVYADGTVWQHP